MSIVRVAGGEQKLLRMEIGLRGYSRKERRAQGTDWQGMLPEVPPKPLKARFHCAALPHAAHLEVCLTLPSFVAVNAADLLSPQVSRWETAV